MNKELIKEVIRDMIRDGELQIGWNYDGYDCTTNVVIKVRDKDGKWIQEEDYWAGIDVTTCLCNKDDYFVDIIDL